jgi:hypothetical protein
MQWKKPQKVFISGTQKNKLRFLNTLISFFFIFRMPKNMYFKSDQRKGMNEGRKIEISISVGNAKMLFCFPSLLQSHSRPDIMQSHNQSLHTV